MAIGYGPHMMGGIGMVIGGILIMLVVLALITLAIVGIVLLARHGKKAESTKNNVYHALAILDERYAKGELSDEEYAQKKAALRKE